jgi:4-amino-4-deoxychorismate lyase
MITKIALDVPLAEGTEPFRSVDPTQNHVNTMDLGITRGDGIFEGLGVNHGTVQSLEPHLARLVRSAKMMDLPELDIDVIRDALVYAAKVHPPAPLLMQKLVITRGIEGGDTLTAFVQTWEGGNSPTEVSQGIRLVALDRGFRHDVAETSPWLLQGAKTLSYAVNKSVLREAARRGADDVLFVSSDGYALEGPSASLIARFGDTFLTPRTDQGILAGTTQHATFELLKEKGFTVGEELITMDKLATADNLWYVSAGRFFNPISHLDDRELVIDWEFTTPIHEMLLARTR